jgi:hypothetical protein
MSYFLYLPELSEKLFDSECAEIFEGCNFEGDSMTICDRVVSMPKSGWNKPIKSFKIPEGKVLKIFNQENLNGESLAIDKDEQCMENVRFTFAQLFASIV